MKRFLRVFGLKEQANLLDSKLYIMKSFFAVAIAYVIAYKNPILKLDIISVLFGLMLTLEPVTLTGIRNGLSQLYATLIGALSTAIIIYAGGINTLTISLSVAFTLYVCLKIDWRAVSPVAIFTSIYMTQYVQKTAEGVPSILLTFRLRICALTFGVVIAILLNYIFALLSYKSMTHKRISFILKSIINNLNNTNDGIKSGSKEKIAAEKISLSATFNDIDWVYSLFHDISKEYDFMSKIAEYSYRYMESSKNIIALIRGITHLNYDIDYILSGSECDFYGTEGYSDVLASDLGNMIEKLYTIKCFFDEGIKINSTEIIYQLEDLDKDIQGNETKIRIFHDIKEMKRNINCIALEVSNISNK